MPVGVVQRLGDRGDQLGRETERDRAFAAIVVQRHAGDELLDQIVRAVVGVPDLVEGHDARVRELGRAAGLAEEPFDIVLGREHAGPGDLDRHGAAQLGVDRPEHMAEGAGPELLEELEPAQPPRLLGRDAGPDAMDRQGPHGLEQPAGESLLGLRVAGCPPQMRQEPVGLLVERLECAITQRAALDMLGDQIERGAGEHAGGERPQFVRIGATRRVHVFSPSPGSQLPSLERRGVTGHFSVVAQPARDG